MATVVTVVFGIGLGMTGYTIIWPLFGAANQLLAALALLAVCLAPWPTRVCGSFEALEWRLGDPDVQTRRTVTIDGVYLNYLFKADGFAGTFKIEGHPETALEKTYWDADDEALFQMTYFDPQDGLLRTFGILMIVVILNFVLNRLTKGEFSI